MGRWRRAFCDSLAVVLLKYTEGYNDEDVPGAKVCEKGHKPRWYAQRNDNPHDLDYGYKRKCADYAETANADKRKAQTLGKAPAQTDAVPA